LTRFSRAGYGPRDQETNFHPRKESPMSDTLLAVQNAHEPVPFISLVAQHQTIAHEVTAAVGRVLAEQKFILGEEVTSFETEIAKYCDSRSAIGCASGTDALILALMALGVGPGDEVITSPFTFFATASAICRLGAKPVFADIDPVSFNINAEAVEAAITPQTKAIMPVHLFGLCADMERLWRIAVRHGLAIVEDACQAIGAEYRGRRAGVLGTIGCFSFFPTKNLGGAGDGGILTTDDADLSKELRCLRVHGDAGNYHHLKVGLNSRLDAIQATILRIKLRHLDQWTDARRRNAQSYRDLFAAYSLSDEIELPTEPREYKHVYNQFTVRVTAGRRDGVLQRLRANHIGAMIYYPIPLHLQPCFDFLGHRVGEFPEAEAASREVLSLPVYPEMPADHAELVVRQLKSAYSQTRAQTEVRRAA
jgi:dTDP-4-amino-4,6-dideoxygalactose transaminase